jgi:tRNA threonylcarbamoyladenosine biosynthesis protein TsaB
MALILLLETATTSCSVALSLDGQIIASKELNERNVHASHITVFIEDVIKQADKKLQDLSAVAISMGPGSYTGLRIGVSTAKGLCYGLDIPLIGVNTLQSMTSGLISFAVYPQDTLFCPMIDARRMEVYTAVFDGKLNEIMPVEAKILDEKSFSDLLENQQMIFFGDGAFKCKEILTSSNAVVHEGFANSANHMANIAELKFNSGQFEDVAYFEPFYLKDFLILKPKTV